jgi:hypothetical protein
MKLLAQQRVLRAKAPTESDQIDNQPQREQKTSP